VCDGVDAMLQIYLYEYSEDFDIVERPRQVYPSAVTWFKCETSRQSAVARPLGYQCSLLITMFIIMNSVL